MNPIAVVVAAALAIIGQPAPSFSAKDIKGEQVSLSDFKGKVVVLEWNNFDCPFVKKQYQKSGHMPKLQETYKGKDVVWLTINSSAEGKQGFLDPEKGYGRVAEEGSKATHYLIDTDGKIGKAYGAKVTPHMFIINKEGVLVYDGAIDSKATPNPDDIGSADPLFRNALDAVLAGKEVSNAKNKPYGCGVKY